MAATVIVWLLLVPVYLAKLSPDPLPVPSNRTQFHPNWLKIESESTKNRSQSPPGGARRPPRGLREPPCVQDDSKMRQRHRPRGAEPARACQKLFQNLRKLHQNASRKESPNTFNLGCILFMFRHQKYSNNEAYLDVFLYHVLRRLWHLLLCRFSSSPKGESVKIISFTKEKHQFS